ncbi:methyl-accepting chemotaxis protein (plasmid) [Pseudomonas silesiensis]
MNIRNISIASRASAGFALLAVLVLALGSFCLWQMSLMRASSHEVDRNWLPSIIALNETSQDMLRLRTQNIRLLLPQDSRSLQQVIDKIKGLKAHLSKSQEAYSKMIVLDKERDVFQLFTKKQQQYLELQSQVINQAQQGNLAEATRIADEDMRGLADEVGNALTELSKLNQDGAARATTDAEQVFASSQQLVIGMMLLTALITIGLAIVLTRSIIRPLREALTIAQVVASGNLTQNIAVNGKDEVAQLQAALRDMQQKLRETIRNIADASSLLASASEELSSVTNDATRGLLQQGAEIEQAATAVNEMTSAVEEVARNAVATSEASRESDVIAKQGREQVVKTVQSIESLSGEVTLNAERLGELAQRINGIGKVLEVIRAIAGQTNLLALNAAIEAARAGEAGRGFAVVADEVRALAHRTQQSTQEIEQMITGIHQGTNQAVESMKLSNTKAFTTLEVARSAGLALDEIALAMSRITERNIVIATASEEQAQVAREVDRNLTNIRDLAVQSSAGANQTSASSQELSRLAVDLNTIVARFSV